ncbi:MAG: T9SS type A sorting domain-containing protein [Deltaproteobacteria bacterium]|nr:T9SS type A sorting domain-containing protein [Deltaproteobacteria bacterium]
MEIFLSFLFLWIEPIRITPDSSMCMFSPPFLMNDNQGECWFVWSYQNFPANRFFVFGRYYNGDSLSSVDTIMPENLVMYLRDLDRDKSNQIWVIGELSPEIWIKRYSNSSWSTAIAVPGFQPYDNFSAVATGDSTGNYNVIWSTDILGYYSIYHSFYDGNVWSDRYSVSDRPNTDSYATDMTTAADGSIWACWICSYGITDSLLISTFNGDLWETKFCIAGDINVGQNYRAAVIEASLTDSSLYCAYRKADGTVCLLRFYTTTSTVDTLWINNEYESTPELACDNNGNLWLVFCDSLSQFNYRLYYSIWNGDSLLSPQLIDTSDGYNPRIIYDGYFDRIWVAFKSWRTGERNIYATYQNLTGICEEGVGLKKVSFEVICSPNPFSSTTEIEFSPIQAGIPAILNIYDINGCRIKHINHFSGIYRWGGRDDTNTKIPSGIYIVEIKTSYFSKLKKLIKLR